jgi:DNA repair exonuclease SbcCD ATPase subunit
VTDLRRALDSAVAGFRPTPDALDRTLRKFRRRQGRQRLLAAGTALTLSLGAVTWLWVGLGGLAQPRLPASERHQLETRLGALERDIGEQESFERRLREELSTTQTVTRELESLLATLDQQRREAPSAAERRQILQRIKQARAALAAHLREVAALKARLHEVTAQLAGLSAEREVLRQWLASLEDPP